MRACPSRPLAVGYTHSDVPEGGVSLQESAFERRLTEEIPVLDEATVAIANDDPERAELLRSQLEAAPLRSYPESVDVLDMPTTEELRASFEGADLVFLDLPMTGATVECTDGSLDLASIAAWRPIGVFLDVERVDETAANAVVEAGAIVAFEGPKITMAERGLKLLGCVLRGLGVADAAALVYDSSAYRVTGVATGAIIQLTSGKTGERFVIDAVAEDSFETEYFVSPTKPIGPGTTVRLAEDFAHGEAQLVGKRSELPETLSVAQVLKLLEDEEVVVVLDEKTYAGVVSSTSARIRRSARRALRSADEDPPSDKDSASNYSFE